MIRLKTLRSKLTWSVVAFVFVLMVTISSVGIMIRSFNEVSEKLIIEYHEPD